MTLGQAEKEAQIREKKREADVMELKVIKLQREELDFEEKVLQASLEESEALGTTLKTIVESMSY